MSMRPPNDTPPPLRPRDRVETLILTFTNAQLADAGLAAREETVARAFTKQDVGAGLEEGNAQVGGKRASASTADDNIRQPSCCFSSCRWWWCSSW